MQITDGTGRSYQAQVTSENRLATTGVAYAPQMHASIVKGEAYQAISGVRNIASLGVYGILALRNDSLTKKMIVTYVRASVDRVEASQAKVEIYLGGTWVAGTAAPTPVNLNTSSAMTASVTAHYNAVPTGSSSSIDAKWIKGPDECTWNKEGSIIIPTSGIISLKITTETNAVNAHGRISFYYVDAAEVARLGI